MTSPMSEDSLDRAVSPPPLRSPPNAPPAPSLRAAPEPAVSTGFCLRLDAAAFDRYAGRLFHEGGCP